MKQYVVDAFTDKVFSGNPAAVCIMDSWISDEMMINITKENNLSETAFAVKEGDVYHLRWFTPGGEIDLCGHATLGTAFVLMNFFETEKTKITFTTLSGELIVEKKGDLYEMIFPAYDLKEVPVTQEMEYAIGTKPVEAYMGRDLLCVLPEDVDITAINPDLDKVKELDGLLLQVTKKGNAGGKYACESRTFAPKLAVPEDPVCGSGHCHIVPYWANALGKDELVCYQASPRSGVLCCRLDGDKVYMSGKAALYSKAEINIG